MNAECMVFPFPFLMLYIPNRVSPRLCTFFVCWFVSLVFICAFDTSCRGSSSMNVSAPVCLCIHISSPRNKKNENLLATMQMKFSFENYAFTLAFAHKLTPRPYPYIFDVNWVVLKGVFFALRFRVVAVSLVLYFGRSFALSIEITWMWQIFGWQHRKFCHELAQQSSPIRIGVYLKRTNSACFSGKLTPLAYGKVCSEPRERSSNCRANKLFRRKFDIHTNSVLWAKFPMAMAP